MSTPLAWPDVPQVRRPSLRHRVRESAQALTLRVVQRRLSQRVGGYGAADDGATNTDRGVVPHFDRDRRDLLQRLREVFAAAGIGWSEERQPWAERPRWHIDAAPAEVWDALRQVDLDLEVRPRGRLEPAGPGAYRWLERLLTREFTETHLRDPRFGPITAVTDPCPAGERWLVSRRTVDGDRLQARMAVEAGVDLSFDSRPRVRSAVDFPIDVVYTWVDADDPAWQVERQAHPPGTGLTAAADVPARFVQSEELRFSLRSLEQFAPWVRRIWVVTSGQRPDWLLQHPRVSLISHEQIWPDPSELPVFNSHAIEANLHRIPGLADHYLYLNDDMFLGRPTSPDTFFAVDGRPRVFPSRYAVSDGAPLSTDRAPDAAGKNNRDLVRLLTGRTVNTKFQHAPYAISRELVCELESRVPEIFRRTGMSRYRSITDVTVSGGLHHSYGLATGRVQPGTLRYCYVDLDKDSRARLLRTIGETRYADVFCLNAVEEAPPGAEVLAMLDAYFPHPAEWERPRNAGAWEAEWIREVEHVDWSEPAPSARFPA